MATTEGQWLEGGERLDERVSLDETVAYLRRAERKVIDLTAEREELIAMLTECKSFVGGVAIADERGDQWRWELFPRLKALLCK